MSKENENIDEIELLDDDDDIEEFYSFPYETKDNYIYQYKDKAYLISVIL